MADKITLDTNRMQEQDSDRKDVDTDEQQALGETGKPRRQRKRKADVQEEAAGAEEPAPTAREEVQPEAQEPTPLEEAGRQKETPEESVATPEALEMIEESEPQAEAEETDETAEAPSDVLPDGLGVREAIEALLFATDSPLPASKIAQVLEQGTSRQVRRHIQQLNERYEQAGAAFRIEEVAGGYQMLTLPKFQPYLTRLLRTRQESRLSPTQMETLAIIAYKQPVLRADIEAVRGVAAGDVVNRLRELGLVKIVGRAEDVGRPLLYGTTKKFLRVFGLGSLDDLPRVEELKAPETQAPRPEETTEARQETAEEQPPQQDEPRET